MNDTDLEARLNALLTEFDQISAWLELPASPDLASMLRKRRDEVASEVVALVMLVRRSGGSIALTVPDPTPPRAPTPEEIFVALRARLTEAFDHTNEFTLLAALIEERERWASLPSEIVFRVLSYIVARVRHLETVHGRQGEKMTALCDAVRTFGKARETNRVNGVFANDKPKAKSWADDAVDHLGALPH